MVIKLSEESEELTTARLRKATLERISKFGKYGDTFDDVLNKMCDVLDNKAKK